MTNLNLLRSVAFAKILNISIDSDELYSLYPCLHHCVDGIAASSTDTNDPYNGRSQILIFKF